ncbi:hypothetical protein B0H16DRAFT_44509 [Mycena metata]|uniref:Uncharacterized protein n=1 Tax=Mycena metata TaxID=1033252 RepID=A0AAD7K061_9AGAR|nr:hypothetical protein B0H16DRAFT_44509 [Mycena metata]
MSVAGRSWDASDYAGLRQFHRAKGFDPDSQEVALHLGHRLFQLSKDANSPIAHVDDWFDERLDEGVIDGDHEESSPANHDAHEEDEEYLFCDSDSKESSTEGTDGRVDGQLEACAQPRQFHQEPNGGGGNSSSMDQGTHTDSQVLPSAQLVAASFVVFSDS